MIENSADRYQIQEQIGSGGMATVYRAQDTVLQRPVALKVLNGQVDRTLKDRFESEAQAVAGLNHPNVVSIYDVGEIEGSPYIVMEYVEGTNLKRLIKERGPLPPHEAISTVSQIGSALAYAHRNRLVHCDVKPHNILISPNGRAKLVDFGIAQAQVDRKRRKAGPQFGTPMYLAPEQAAGQVVSPATDVYGLGLVLWEALTGRPPERAAPDEPVDLDLSDPRLPKGIAPIIAKATAPDPAARYASVEEMLNALRAWQGKLHGGQTVAYKPLPVRDAASRTEVFPRAEVTVPASMRSGNLQRKRRGFAAWPLLGVLLLLLGLGGIGLAVGDSFRDALGGVLGDRTKATTTVPALEGKSLATATRVAGDSGLKLEVTPSPESNQPDGTVLSQAPQAGTQVPKGSDVSVVVAGNGTATAPSISEATPGNTTGPTDAPAQVDPDATPTVTINDGERVAQLLALAEPVRVEVSEDNNTRIVTLQPGQYLVARADRRLRIEARPARELFVTIDGGKERGTLLEIVERNSGKDINTSNAWIIRYGRGNSSETAGGDEDGNGRDDSSGKGKGNNGEDDDKEGKGE